MNSIFQEIPQNWNLPPKNIKKQKNIEKNKKKNKKNKKHTEAEKGGKTAERDGKTAEKTGLQNELSLNCSKSFLNQPFGFHDF